MKIIIASFGVLIAGLGATVPADASNCTHNAFAMGNDAAKQACDDIITGWIPLPVERGVRGYARHISLDQPIPEPEKTCSLDQVVECKNAMAQYLRSNQGQACASLISQNAHLSRRASGSADSAGAVWRGYVTTTCNM